MIWGRSDPTEDKKQKSKYTMRSHQTKALVHNQEVTEGNSAISEHHIFLTLSNFAERRLLNSHQDGSEGKGP